MQKSNKRFEIVDIFFKFPVSFKKKIKFKLNQYKNEKICLFINDNDVIFSGSM